MLEDFTMEKKPTGRSAQAPGKASGTDLKKSQDVAISKPFPRSSRRRESNGSNGAKLEPNRKPVPQKNKSFDKRPRPRGQYYGSGKEYTQVAEEDAEYGSVFVPGSKKQNLNHLLNFHYAPRESTARSFPSGWGRHGSARWLTSTQKHKYNKEQFLQANCQFVVKSDGNYSAYTSDPDALVNWDLIEQIRLQSSEMLSCPICLYPPVAAKMTRCGHVYCWACILHYLALSDKTWRKCPICYEAVHKQDLKSVIAVPHIQLNVGEEITMRLMKRERGSLVALPVGQCGIRPVDKLLSVSETVVDTVHSKLLSATPEEVLQIVNIERSELQKQLTDDQNCPETCFIEQAIELLDQRQSSLSGIVVIPPTEVQQREPQELKSDLEKLPIKIKPDVTYNSAFDNECANSLDLATSSSYPEDVLSEEILKIDVTAEKDNERQRYESMSSEGLESDDGNTAITAEDLEIVAPSASDNSATPPVKHFYFYQAADGQHIYLHAVNVRMLEHVYGSLENCPVTLTGQIVEKESGSMTEELRRRLRYLQHLPVTCQFEVAEIQLKPPVVSKSTLEYFKDQLEVRRRRRQHRARDERRREKKITEEENKRWGRYPAAHIRIESHRHFPQCGTDLETAVTNLSVASSVTNSPSPSRDSVSPVSASVESLTLDTQEVHPVGPPDSSGMSFARMLREGKSKMEGRTHFDRKPKPQTCLPATAVGRRRLDSEPDSEDYVPAPTFSQSFSDAIALALEKANQEPKKGEVGSSSGKKKKKQKQKILFATTMACSGK